jgi:hypothetical protein
LDTSKQVDGTIGQVMRKCRDIITKFVKLLEARYTEASTLDIKLTVVSQGAI